MTMHLAWLVALAGLVEPPPSEQHVALYRAPGVEIDVRWTLGRPLVVEVRAERLAKASSERLTEAVRVYSTAVGVRVEPDQAPLLGSVERVEEGRLARFTSRFAVEPGRSYHVDLEALGVREPAGSRFIGLAVPAGGSSGANAAAATTVTRVAPAADVVPENLLKFYVEFSGPMSRGEAYEHLQLLDGSGKAIDLPFLELGEELWNPSQTRFTVLFDPGRIKSGLKPREEVGPVLEAGKTYTLVVGPRWPDAEGRPLARDHRKTFRVTKADMTPPDPARWTIDPPAAGTRRALVVRFPEPLDRALLGRLLAVADHAGHPIAGVGRVADDERSWSFTPETPWLAGPAVLLIGRELEDLAGNSIGRPFEVDAFEPIQRRVVAETVRRTFTVAP